MAAGLAPVLDDAHLRHKSDGTEVDFIQKTKTTPVLRFISQSLWYGVQQDSGAVSRGLTFFWELSERSKQQDAAIITAQRPPADFRVGFCSTLE